MAAKKKLSLKEKLAQERKKRDEAAKVTLAPKKSFKTAKKDVKKIETTVERIHEAEAPASKPTKKKKVKEPKERFTLWLPISVYNEFKIKVATRKGSGSDYIEALLRKDLKIK